LGAGPGSTPRLARRDRSPQSSSPTSVRIAPLRCARSAESCGATASHHPSEMNREFPDALRDKNLCRCRRRRSPGARAFFLIRRGGCCASVPASDSARTAEGETLALGRPRRGESCGGVARLCAAHATSVTCSFKLLIAIGPDRFSAAREDVVRRHIANRAVKAHRRCNGRRSGRRRGELRLANSAMQAEVHLPSASCATVRFCHSIADNTVRSERGSCP